MIDTQRLKLCLVEDDPIMGESLTHRFSLEGVFCDWHRTAADALSAMEKTGYGALVSDIRLPDMDGEAMFATGVNRCHISLKNIALSPSTLPATVILELHVNITPWRLSEMMYGR